MARKYVPRLCSTRWYWHVCAFALSLVKCKMEDDNRNELTLRKCFFPFASQRSIHKILANAVFTKNHQPMVSSENYSRYNNYRKEMPIQYKYAGLSNVPPEICLHVTSVNRRMLDQVSSGETVCDCRFCRLLRSRDMSLPGLTHRWWL